MRGVLQPRDSGDTVNRAWQLIYGTTLTASLAGLGGIAYCVVHNLPTLAIGSLAFFLIAVIGFRTAWEINILHGRRMRLNAQERAFEARQGVFELDKERTLRELADQEGAMRQALDAERAKLRRELADEQDRMETELANKKAMIQRKAVRLAFKMAENGIAPEQQPAEVIVLPVGENRPTIMGTGTTNP